MKNHLLPFCLAVLLPALSFGQTVSYKVTEDDPTPKALGINLEPFFCEAGANSIYIGWEARANLDFKKLLSFQAAYRTLAA